MRLDGRFWLLPLMMAWPLGAAAEPGHMTLPRSQGDTIDWFLDRRGASEPQGVLIVLQGSGCASATTNRNLDAAKGLLPEFAVVMVEKYGVSPADRPQSVDDCKPAFFAHHTVSQRVSDTEAVIERLRTMPWWNGKLVLFGGSEGGAVVQILAGRVHPDAAVIFSAGTGIPFRDAFVQVIPPDLAAEAPAQLARARSNRLSPEIWAGNSYRWWADIIDRPLWEDALKARSPILVVQGARDRSNPAGSARALRDAFEKAGQCNLTYREYGDYDHAMVDSSGASHLQEVLSSTSTWIRDQLVAEAPKPCT